MTTFQTLSELAATVAAAHEQGQTLFVRYSKGPDADTGSVSLNHQTGRREAGLSCLALNGDTTDKREWYEAYPERWVAMQVRDYSHFRQQGLNGTRGWVLAGRMVGRGADGEPCVEMTEAIGWISDECINEALAAKPIF